jgi:hypothetical protein
MMTGKFPGYLEECLYRLDRGESLPDVLEDYPEHSEQLKSLLLVAMASRSFPMPVPSHTTMREANNRMLGEMDDIQEKKSFRKTDRIPALTQLLGGLVSFLRSGGYLRLAPSYRLAMITMALFISGGFLTINTAAANRSGNLIKDLRSGLARVQWVFVNPVAELPVAVEGLIDESPLEMDSKELAVNDLGVSPLVLQRNQVSSTGGENPIVFDLLSIGEPEPSEAEDPEIIEEAVTKVTGKPADHPGKGDDKSKDDNPGKALGKNGENPGKALGKNKDKPEKPPKSK